MEAKELAAAVLTKKGGSKSEEVTERTVWSICFDCDRSCLEQGRSVGASIAMRVYHNTKLRMSMIRRPLGSSYRMSFVVKKEMPKKSMKQPPEMYREKPCMCAGYTMREQSLLEAERETPKRHKAANFWVGTEMPRKDRRCSIHRQCRWKTTNCGKGHRYNSIQSS